MAQPSNPTGLRAKLVLGFGRKFKSKNAYSEDAADRYRTKQSKIESKKLVKKAPRRDSELNELGEREYATLEAAPLTMAATRTKSTKGSVDHGEVMHALAHHDSFDSLLDKPHMKDRLRDPAFSSRSDSTGSATIVCEEDEERVANLPDDLWARIASFLSPADAAGLAIASKTLLSKLGMEHLTDLNQPENKHERIEFLHKYDVDHPDHLLCFPCAQYHRRSSAGDEKLVANFVTRPVFSCPSVTSSYLPRTRIAHGRELPYSFIQLAIRHEKYSTEHGISHEQLGRRWKCTDSKWEHRSRYLVHNGRLLMRVVSTIMVPPAHQMTETAMREILYERYEYTPYFSVCAHWRDGELMDVCKCMLSHVPSPPESYVGQLRKRPSLSYASAHPNFIVTGCDFCRPARRCPECPSEYLVEIRMGEDPTDNWMRFKHTLVVTRWCDLGDGSSPYASPEWTAVHSLDSPYDSFTHTGRRSVAGIFESRASGSIPGQRLISLNPKSSKRTEEDHGWY